MTLRRETPSEILGHHVQLRLPDSLYQHLAHVARAEGGNSVASIIRRMLAAAVREEQGTYTVQAQSQTAESPTR